MLDLFKKHLKSNPLIYLIVILSFLVGVSVGAFTLKIIDNQQKENLFYYLKDFFQLLNYDNIDSFIILRQSLTNNIQLLSLNWIFGALIITAPLAISIIAFKGFVIGFTVALLIEKFNILGILIFIFAILPQNIILIPVFIITTVTSLSFLKSFLLEKTQEFKTRGLPKKYFAYTLIFVFMLIFIICACLIESYISPIFIKILSKNII